LFADRQHGEEEASCSQQLAGSSPLAAWQCGQAGALATASRFPPDEQQQVPRWRSSLGQPQVPA
jgi:hypothetical protein